ncbi:hypothetical protein TWF481_003569 [Arthrobotrys musiformis]|uniref:Uncharacterized protein n=1 Tax=Arthrobotrys musiformis TaxID=47236 RepID=A0AAV9WI91_9PEZI
MVDLVRVYCEVLSVFPSLNSLTIAFPCSEEIRSHLLAAIFHKISTYSWYPHLKSLTIVLSYMSHHREEPNNASTFSGLYASCSTSSQEFFSQTSNLREKYDYSLSDATVNITPPPSLQKAAVIVEDGECGYADLVGAYAPILQFSISTLKTLYIAAQALFISYRHPPAEFAPDVQLQTYPAVKDLWIAFDGSTGVPAAGYDEIARRFPNVENLRIDETTTNRGWGSLFPDHIYHCLRRLKYIKTARVPWPRSATVSDPAGYQDMDGISFALRNCIRGWDGITAVDGWNDLEYIDFVSNQSRRWNGYRSKGGWQRKVVRLERDEATVVKRTVIWEETDARRTAGRYALMVKGMYPDL